MRVVNLSNFQQFAAINLTKDPGVDPGKHPIPNCCDFNIVWQLTDGKVARCVLAMRVAAGFTPTPTLAEQARAAITAGGVWTAFAAFLSTGTSLTGVQLRDRRLIDQPLVASTGTATPGTSPSPALPSEVALVTTLRTAKTGQGNRGRMFQPGWATNALGTGDVVAVAAVNAYQAWVDNIAAAMSGIGGQWGLRQPHRVPYTSPRTGAQIPERIADCPIVNAVSVRDNHWDSQRRRGLK